MILHQWLKTMELRHHIVYEKPGDTPDVGKLARKDPDVAIHWDGGGIETYSQDSLSLDYMRPVTPVQPYRAHTPHRELPLR